MADHSFTLNNGLLIPQFGDAETIDQVIKTAIKSGYRLIAPRDQGFDACYKAVLASLEQLKLDYIDLYLIHWPGTQKVALHNTINRDNRLGSWRALEKLYHEGRVKNIGVSNYTIRHLEELLAQAAVPPSVLQVEYHPLYAQPDLAQFCRKHCIQLQAYSSLGQGELLDGTFPVPLLEELAGKYQTTVAHLLLRWGLQHQAVVIPKSTHPDRIRDNLRCFDIEISSEDMEALDNLSETLPKKFCWDPKDVM
ncbi:hypothetical protein H4R33_005322 [Dimargaris cristalligena]|nr:hypothetical protein H4R33_005322 [Dimargaris cristalligena]